MSNRSFHSPGPRLSGLPGRTDTFWSLPLPMAVSRAADGVFRAVNGAFEALTGYAAGEIVGRSVADIGFYAQGDRPHWLGDVAVSAGAIPPMWRQIRTKSGATRSVLLAMRRLAVGGEPCLVTSLVDAPACPPEAPGLPEDKQRYRRLFHERCTAAFMLEWHEPGCVGRVVEANECARRLLGYTGEELRQMTLADWDTASSEPPLPEVLGRFAEGRGHTFERFVRTKDGRTVCLEICGRLLAWKNGTVLFAQARDITEQRWMEEVRRFDDENLRGALAQRNVALFRLDEQLHLSWTFAPKGRRTLAWLFGPPRLGAAASPEIARLRRRLYAALSSGRPVRMNLPRPGAGDRFFEISARPVRDPAGRVVGFTGVVLNIRDRKRAGADLGAAGGVFDGSVSDITNQRYVAVARGLVEARSAPGSFLGNIVARVASALEQEFAFVLQTPSLAGGPARLAAFCREGSLAEGIEMPLADGPCGELLTGEARVVPGGLARVAPHTVEHWADGADSAVIVPFNAADGLLLGYLGVMSRRPIVDERGVRRALEVAILPVAMEIERRHEVDLRRRIEQRLAHSEKYEALGALAGGIAHDFNNILTAILNYTMIARAESATEGERRTCLAKVAQAGRRAQELVRQIMTFDRCYHAPQSNTRFPVALTAIVSDALGLVRPAISSAIVIDRRDHPSTPMVLADRIQIHQVVTNLCINAVQAIGDRPGQLTIELAPFTVDQAMTRVVGGLSCGLHARLTVSDTGRGMDVIARQRIFEPYFTTKPEGEGTGLGLAVVQRIVQALGGAIDVSSRPGAGTTFHVYLPASTITSVEHGADAGPAVSGGHGQRILVVDDDPLSGDSLRRFLEGIGYRVALFDCAPAALAAFWARPGEFELVLTDHQMPEMTGTMLAEHIAHVQPKLPIIIMVGRADEVNASVVRACGATAMLVKPIDFSSFAAMASRLLG